MRESVQQQLLTRLKADLRKFMQGSVDCVKHLDGVKNCNCSVRRNCGFQYHQPDVGGKIKCERPSRKQSSRSLFFQRDYGNKIISLPQLNAFDFMYAALNCNIATGDINCVEEIFGGQPDYLPNILQLVCQGAGVNSCSNKRLSLQPTCLGGSKPHGPYQCADCADGTDPHSPVTATHLSAQPSQYQCR